MQKQTSSKTKMQSPFRQIQIKQGAEIYFAPYALKGQFLSCGYLVSDVDHIHGADKQQLAN